MRRAFSASELAELRLPGVPSARQSCSELIARIAQTTPELVARRKGRGGGLVVDLAALPDEARAELARRESADLVREAAEHEADKRQLVAVATGDLTARQRQIMEARSTLLLAIEARAGMADLSRDRAIHDFVAEANAGRLTAEQIMIIRRAKAKGDEDSDNASLSVRTLNRWFSARKRAGIAGLAPELTRSRESLPAWFTEFQRHYARPQKPSVAEALRSMVASWPSDRPRPSEKQARRALARLPQLAQLRGREGALAMRARLAYKARDFLPILPTSVYTADGKTFDAEVAHPLHGQPFRPELTTIVDVGTRRIVGWSASLDENTFGVVDALRRACAGAGIPAIFYTDRGPGYRNKAMDETLSGFLGRAGITPMRALPYNSQAKGAVERINQIYTATAKAEPTYLGPDMDKQAKLIAFKETRRELALTGQSRLLPSWSDFLEAVDRTIEAYNNRPHSELPKIFDPQLSRKRHLTPNEFWSQKCEGFEPIIPDQAELDDMFRPYVIRRTRRALIEWEGNSYFAIELEPFHGQDVAVGYDIRDASRVWVRTIDEVDGSRVPGKLIAIAAFEGHKTRYVPVSFEQAAMERRNKGRLRRVERKAEVIRQEIAPPALVELRPAPEPARPVEILEIQSSEAGPQVERARRPIFRDEPSFARWISENAAEATEADRAFVAELLTDHSQKELLRMSGVDLDALRKLVRTQA